MGGAVQPRQGVEYCLARACKCRQPYAFAALSEFQKHHPVFRGCVRVRNAPKGKEHARTHTPYLFVR